MTLNQGSGEKSDPIRAKTREKRAGAARLLSWPQLKN
jgi:hypothetical protein